MSDGRSATREKPIVNPAWIPILSLLTRLSMAGKLTEESDTDLVEEFKSKFLNLLDSPVIQVRNLAAKSYVAFTDLKRFVKWETTFSRKAVRVT